MSYVRVNWADGSGGGTPVDATNLNNMDAGIAALDTGKADLAGAAFTGNVTTTGSMKVFGTAGVFFSAGGLSGKFSAQATAPGSPADGDLWLDISIVL